MEGGLSDHGSVGAARRAARQDREQDETATGKSGGRLFIVSRFGCQMLTHLPLNVKNRRPGRAPLGGSPYHVGIRDTTENQRNGVVKNSVPVTVLSNIRPQGCRGEPKARPSVACGFYTFPGTRPAGSLRPLETSNCQLMTIFQHPLSPFSRPPKFIPCRFLPLIPRFFHSGRNFLLDVEGYPYTNFILHVRSVPSKSANLHIYPLLSGR